MLTAGGPIMAVLGVLSVLVVAAVLWKAWQFWTAGLWRPGFPGRSEARSGDFLAAIFGEADQLAGGSRRTRLERAGERHFFRMQTGLRLLETAVVLAPLLGLLGTVLGMIQAFRALETASGSASPAVLAGGIWEALLTTAFGMAIAIVAAAALAAFDGAVDRARHRFGQALEAAPAEDS